MLGGSILLLLLVCCGALLESGSESGLWCFAGLGLVGAALVYSQFVSGEWPGIDMFLDKVHWWARRHNETSRQNSRQWDCCKALARKLRDPEQPVGTLVELGVAPRLEEIKGQEQRCKQTEYPELRAVWRAVLIDPNTPEEVRKACLTWLARHPGVLDSLAQRLTKRGLLWETELPENRGEPGTRKYWIH